jgi:hypothetical protein
VAVVCEPGDAEGRDLTPVQHREAAAKLAALWTKIGFSSYEGAVWFLDCHLQQTQDLLDARLQEFGDRCRAYGDAAS